MECLCLPSFPGILIGRMTVNGFRWGPRLYGMNTATNYCLLSAHCSSTLMGDNGWNSSARAGHKECMGQKHSIWFGFECPN